MAERYAPRIGEQQLPGARLGGAGMPNIGVDIGTAAGVGDVGKAVSQLGAMAFQKQEEYDMLVVEEANNRYTQSLHSHINDSETGLLATRKGKDAIADRSVSKDFGAKSKEIATAIRDEMKMNKRQAELFERVSINTAFPFFKQMQDYENQQLQEYKGQVFQGTMETQRQAMLNAPYEKTAFDTAWSYAEAAINLQYQHLPEEAMTAMKAQIKSQWEADRIMVVAAKDPLSAYAMAEASDVLNADQKADLVSKLKGEADKVYYQQEADAIWDQFGRNEEAANNFIRDNFQGSERDAISGYYSNRLGGDRQAEAHSRQDLAQAQQDFFQSNFIDNMLSEKPFDMAQADEWLRTNKISINQYDAIRNYNHNIGNTARASEYLRDKVHGKEKWDAMSIADKDAALQNHFYGSTDNSALMEELRDGIMNGRVTAADINNQWSAGRKITTAQRAELQEMLRSTNPKENPVLSKINTMHYNKIDVDVKRLVSYERQGDIPVADITNIAKSLYTQAYTEAMASGTLPKDPEQLNQFLDKIRKDAVVQAIQQDAAIKLEESNFNWSGIFTPGSPWFTEEPTAVGERIEEYRAEPVQPIVVQTAQASGGFTSSGPYYLASSLPPSPRAMLGNIPEASLSDAFGVKRPTGIHNGVDFRAPAGTPIQIVDFGLDNMVVTSVIKSDTAGNALTFSGKDRSGRTIYVTIMHMQSTPLKKVGDSLAINDIIGYVGNTGRSRGNHMHLEMFESGGKFFDPINYLSMVPSARGQGETLSKGGDTVYKDLIRKQEEQ